MHANEENIKYTSISYSLTHSQLIMLYNHCATDYVD